MKTILPLAAVIALCAGCVQTRCTMADGTTFNTTRVLWNGSIGKASVTQSNGASLTVEGYQSDTAQLIQAVAAGVAAGLKSGAPFIP